MFHICLSVSTLNMCVKSHIYRPHLEVLKCKKVNSILGGLSEKQLLKLMKKSFVARNAVLCWNTLNRKIRELVVETKVG